MSKRINTAKWSEKYGRWQINVQKNGVRKSFVCSTPGRAGQREANRKADAWLALEEEERAREDVSFFDAVGKWEESLKTRTSKANWRPALSRVNKWAVPRIGHVLVRNITEQNLQDVVDAAYKMGGLSAKTLKSLRGDLTNIIKFCRKSGYTNLRPEGLEVPKGARRMKKTILHPNDLQKVFTSENTYYKGVEMFDRNIYAYRLLIAEGLRPGELLAIKRTCVRGGYLEIKQAYNDDGEVTAGKNENAARIIKLSQHGMQAVKEQLALLKKECVISPLLFPSRDGGYCDQGTFRSAWYRYCAYNGIPRITPYELRHTFVSITKDMPEGLKRITVGHSKNMDTEGIYSHEMTGDRELAAEYITDAFNRILSVPKNTPKNTL